MLGTYFTIILALFIAMVVGAVLGYSGNLEDNIKNPLESALNKYDDKPGDNTHKAALKAVWNEVQKEVGPWRTSYKSPSSNFFLQLKCCGVNDVTDWTKNADHFHFTDRNNKPEGCCKIGSNGEELDTTEQKVEYHRNLFTFLINFCI